MSKPRQYFPVTFKHGDEIVFTTRGYIEEQKGEPHDTANIYERAAEELRLAIMLKKAPKDAFQQTNSVAIEYPDGQSKSYTGEQMGQLLDEHSELIRYRPAKNSRVIVTIEGGFSGGVMKGTNVTLDNLSDDDYKRVTEIIDLLQTRRARLNYTDGAGDFGYYVKVGDQDVDPKNMRLAFNGGPWSRTPVVVQELQKILGKYAEKGTRGIELG